MPGVLLFEGLVLCRLRSDDAFGSIARSCPDVVVVEGAKAAPQTNSSGGGNAGGGQPGAGAAPHFYDGVRVDAVAGDGRKLRRVCALVLYIGWRVDGQRP